MRAKLSYFVVPWLVGAAAVVPVMPVSAQERSVEIAVDIFEYRLSDEEQFGLMYEFVRKKGDLLDSQLLLPGTQGQAETPIPALELTFDLLNSEYGDLNATLQAAVRTGRAQILSNPRLVVKEGNTAKIVTGEQVPITTLEIRGSRQTLATVNKDTGVKLYVTPSVLQDEYILLSLQAEVSEIVALEAFTPTTQESGKAPFELPRVQRRTVQTVVMVPNTNSIFIGGLIRESSTKTQRKVPIVGDIPYLGMAFRSNNDQLFFTETWFMITPTILERGQGGTLPLSSVGEGLADTLLNATETIDTATGALLLEDKLEEKPETQLDYDDSQ